MIDSETAEHIRTLTLAFWQEEVTKPQFVAQAVGKEIGHRIASLVEERTTALLEQTFRTARQRNRQGKAVDRSMGDIWVFSQGIFNPINVKAGEANQGGQPNIVALRKLLRAILSHQIDSYYLLIVKMVIGKDSIALNNVYLADILDHLDYVAFDSGPGQMMLKEKSFYAMMDQGSAPAQLTFDQKIERLFGLLDDADHRLIENRARVRATIDEMHKIYVANKDHPLNQSGLNLQ